MFIENDHVCRYLGVFINYRLNWCKHIDSIYSKLMKCVGIFCRVRVRDILYIHIWC